MKLFQTSFHDIIDCSDEDTYYTFRSVVNLILVVTNVHPDWGDDGNFKLRI